MNNHDYGETWGQIALLFCVLAGVSVAIVFLPILPPLNDYPNHLARMHILANLDQSPALQLYYRNVMAAQPNLAMDIIVPLLSRWMPLEMAGRVFIALTLLVTAAGTLALHFSLHRRWSVWPLLAFLFIYHRMFLWGLLNFSFGIGMALFAIAVWVAVRPKGAGWRVTASVPCALVVYICHLYAFGFYAIVIGGYELYYLLKSPQWHARARDVAIAAIQFLLPIYLFLFESGAPAVASETRWGTIWRKLEAPFDVIYQYHLVFDVGCLLVIAALIGWGLFRKHVQISRRMVPALIVLLVVYLAMPDQLFSGYGADRRLPIMILLLGIASADWQHARVWWREPLVVAFLALFAVRSVLIAQMWHRSDAVYAEYLQAIDMLPKGTKLLFYTLHAGTQSLSSIPELEIGDMAVVRRDAFVPALFTTPPLAAESISFSPEAQPIAFSTPHNIQLRPAIERLRNPDYVRRRGLFRREVLRNYDYMLIAHPEALPPQSPIPKDLSILFRGKDFVLAKLPQP
ncbi:MAG: hypothetical protein J0H79_12205 [Alphaproteobacteria bacterium]|jgi:hypothetical protein|nr:hypothetical protein [Alphaproteobacteria bacterium]MBN9568356.1 hypothetical protein [Alphaproteobacteria bacterium]OJU58387.1 MAG: hypothetical protein BGO00_09795 [Alphaproteobacteria bacterium 62-8]